MAELLARLPPERRREALTHRAWAGPRRPSYERLEFLGDAVLALEATEELMRRHPGATEGQLTAMRQQVVSGAACARAAADAGLGEQMAAGAPERATGTAREIAGRESVLAALAEAVIGGGWSELGRDMTRQAVISAFAPELDAADPSSRDPKTTLQEVVAGLGDRVDYQQLEPDGPPHERTFTAVVWVGGIERGRGRGPSKQAAERAAARVALDDLERG